ncbi:MAG: S-methyl-5'-thioadenosine phosphorylase [Caldicoprobacterales bacterium]|nr:S-methyl-5'-thioadenosine phosphorylase [Clostridiales bacterium]
MNKKADIGVIGGSGLYSLLEQVEEVSLSTPYGQPSDKLFLGEIHGKSIAFLPRHGREHRLPPHKVNYRANIYAMKELGIRQIVATTAAGSLQPHIRPGDLIVSDQFIDRTHGRPDTFFDGPEVVHISMARPYCPRIRQLAVKEAERKGLKIHKSGTVVVIQGPRFSSGAESRWYTSMGCSLINMTQYPEVVLARELGICYANISLITDYDAGLEGRDDIAPVTHEEVLRVFEENSRKVKDVILSIIRELDVNFDCSCSD